MAINSRALFTRKGFLFTTLAVLIVTGIVLYVSSQDRLYSRTLAQMNRVHTMDAYIANLEEDLPRAAYIACFRSLIGMEEYISTNGAYIGDFDTGFTSIFTNGTINNTVFGIMNDSSFDDFTARFQQLAIRQGIVANLTVISVNATQSDPWYVDLTATVHVQLRDTATSVSFNRTVPVLSRVPIIDIKDPLYSVGTLGRAPNVVRAANFSAPYISGSDVSLLRTLVNSSYYVESSLAPSFLQRFIGDLSPSPYGIVSLVDINELRAQGFSADTCKSVADYIYFGPTDSDPNNYIVGMDSNTFWLDDANLATFSAAASVAGAAPCP